jgi:hypothetical protein
MQCKAWRNTWLLFLLRLIDDGLMIYVPSTSNALTSLLLSIGTDVPATVTHSAAAGFVTSTAPQSLPHAQLWLQALGGGSVTVDGAEIHQPSFVSLDTDGRFVSVPAAQLSSDDVTPTRIPDADALAIFLEGP